MTRYSARSVLVGVLTCAVRALVVLPLALPPLVAACENERARACASDPECPVGAGICVEGACVVQACAGRGDCPSGTCGIDGLCRAVECDPESLCALGFACIDGLCRSPRSEGLEVGVEIWDSVVPPSPLPPDAFRADVAPPIDQFRPPPDARPTADGAARDGETLPVSDASPVADARADGGDTGDAGDTGNTGDTGAAHPLLAAFFALTFTFERGDCALREPASPKDLWVEEAGDGSLTARLSVPGGGSGLDLSGTLRGEALSLAALAPFPVLPLCDTVLDLRLDGVLSPDGRLSGLADWHTFTTAPDCPAPTDCHRYDHFESGPQP